VNTTHTSRGRLSFRWILPIILIYLAGGTIQYFGLASVTQCNILGLLLLMPIFLWRSSWRQAHLEWPIVIFILFVILFHLTKRPPLGNTLTYVYYLLCTLVAAVAGRAYSNRWYGRWPARRFFRFAKWFLVLQLCVTFVQANFTETYVQLARVPIGYEDAIFGTFFLQSDAALAAVCELLVILAFILPCSLRNRVQLTILALGVVFLGNSKAAQGSILTLILLFTLYAAAHSARLTKSGFGLLAVLAVMVYAALSFSLWSDHVTVFFQQAQDDYFRRDQWETASRFAPLGQIISQGIDIFGQGPLTYYNPIEKTWLYNSGFSTLYTLYIDFGLLGFSLYFLYQSSLIFKFAKSIRERLAFFLVLASFSSFNFALSDLSFVFFFNFALMEVYRLRTQPQPLVRKIN